MLAFILVRGRIHLAYHRWHSKTSHWHQIRHTSSLSCFRNSSFWLCQQGFFSVVQHYIFIYIHMRAYYVSIYIYIRFLLFHTKTNTRTSTKRRDDGWIPTLRPRTFLGSELGLAGLPLMGISACRHRSPVTVFSFKKKHAGNACYCQKQSPQTCSKQILT